MSPIFMSSAEVDKCRNCFRTGLTIQELKCLAGDAKGRSRGRSLCMRRLRPMQGLLVASIKKSETFLRPSFFSLIPESCIRTHRVMRHNRHWMIVRGYLKGVGRLVFDRQGVRFLTM